MLPTSNFLDQVVTLDRDTHKQKQQPLQKAELHSRRMLSRCFFGSTLSHASFYQRFLQTSQDAKVLALRARRLQDIWRYIPRLSVRSVSHIKRGSGAERLCAYLQQRGDQLSPHPCVSADDD
jgi:hypothetical protein